MIFNETRLKTMIHYISLTYFLAMVLGKLPKRLLQLIKYASVTDHTITLKFGESNRFFEAVAGERFETQSSADHTNSQLIEKACRLLVQVDFIQAGLKGPKRRDEFTQEEDTDEQDLVGVCSNQIFFDSPKFIYTKCKSSLFDAYLLDYNPKNQIATIRLKSNAYFALPAFVRDLCRHLDTCGHLLDSNSDLPFLFKSQDALQFHELHLNLIQDAITKSEDKFLKIINSHIRRINPSFEGFNNFAGLQESAVNRICKLHKENFESDIAPNI